MNIELKTATIEHIDEILTLHYRYQVDSINEEDKADGFITTAFTKTHLSNLIEHESGLFIAVLDNKIVAYAMAASWQFWSQWPMFQFMIENLHDSQLEGLEMNVANSYQYGPVCVDKSVRGHGVFEQVFNYSLEQMSKRYPILVTFINKINPRSYQAHTKKTPLVVIKEFEFNNNQYYKLACKTCEHK
ncbi:GNAT family acetyltransferase [Pseudoalteromonas sp. MMG010]|uniref:GNAT family acetyltransferase n=1 Tax=Pseudoalteromonas sp. MMG010 TaxID=2822685 RepID=UPI001B39E118|nr:GNAT family acetyltransferase [Pseudoalteromonas sp. MMG010]MBQ4833145.1 GNAT family acetyltransferase [Pseudoalteromonas sp. MMG010]